MMYTRGPYGNAQNVSRIKTEHYSKYIFNTNLLAFFMKLKKKTPLARFDPGTSRLLEMYFTTALVCKLKYSDEIKIYNESILIQGKTTHFQQKQWVIKIKIYAYFCLFSASKVIMSYGKLIARFTTGGHDIFTTCPAKSMHRKPEQVMNISYPPVVQRVITT